MRYRYTDDLVIMAEKYWIKKADEWKECRASEEYRLHTALVG